MKEAIGNKYTFKNSLDAQKLIGNGHLQQLFDSGWKVKDKRISAHLVVFWYYR